MRPSVGISNEFPAENGSCEGVLTEARAEPPVTSGISNEFPADNRWNGSRWRAVGCTTVLCVTTGISKEFPADNGAATAADANIVDATTATDRSEAVDFDLAMKRDMELSRR